MLTLTKFNIDLDKQIITGGLKTDAGKNRVIPIHPKIIKYIKQWYDKNGESLICDENGKQITAKKYRIAMYYPALEAIGVRKLNPHCCRHTFATRAKNAGMDTESLRRLIGHSKYSFTADTYTHTDIDELKKAMNMI